MKLSITAQNRLILHRFISIKRGYWSFILMVVLIALSLAAEVLVNSRALVVRIRAGGIFRHTER